MSVTPLRAHTENAEPAPERLPATSGGLVRWLRKCHESAHRRYGNCTISEHRDTNKVTYEVHDCRLSLRLAVGVSSVSCDLFLDGRPVSKSHLVAQQHMPAQVSCFSELLALVVGFAKLSPCQGLPPRSNAVALDMSQWDSARHCCPATLQFADGKPPAQVIMLQPPLSMPPYLVDPNCNLVIYSIDALDEAKTCPRCSALADDTRMDDTKTPGRALHELGPVQAESQELRARSLARKLSKCKTLQIHHDRCKWPLVTAIHGTQLSLTFHRQGCMTVHAPWQHGSVSLEGETWKDRETPYIDNMVTRMSQCIGVPWCNVAHFQCVRMTNGVYNKILDTQQVFLGTLGIGVEHWVS